VIFEPLDFIARLAALVPKPRVNLTRFHGVFAPNSQSRRGHQYETFGVGRHREFAPLISMSGFAEERSFIG